MLGRLRELLAAGETFALETTLATRHYLRFIAEAQAQGYKARLFSFWLNSPELAVEWVAARVREGGHNIPDAVIRRRYTGGLRQFFSTYRTAVSSWAFMDNSEGRARLIASGTPEETIIAKADIWQQLTHAYHV